MSLFNRLKNTFEKLPFSAMELTVPVWAGYILHRRLEKLEDQGSISNFKSKISRIKKHRYRMELEISFTEQQARKGLSHLIDTLPSLKRG